MKKKKSILVSLFKKHKKKEKKEKYGFTLIELLIVIAIIGVLTTIIIIKLDIFGMTEDAKISKTVSELNSIKDAVSVFVIDTGQFPADCRVNNNETLCCKENTDPFLNSLGVPGWNGPYLDKGLWNTSHAWGGQIGLLNYDFTGDEKNELWLVLDDDAPGCDWSDNSGVIPEDSLLKINNLIDKDSDLGNGNFFRGNEYPFAEGEGAWRIYRIGQE